MRPTLRLLASVLLPVAAAFAQGPAPNMTCPPPDAPAPAPAAGGGRAMSAEQQAAQQAQTAATAADHQDMMDQLHIASLRRGRDGRDKCSQFFANYDEAKANPFPTLPDPLVLNNGKKVTSAKMWWDQRRPELFEMFDREVYGRVPKNVPAVKWEVIKTTEEKVGDVDVVTKQVQGTVDNSGYPAVTVKIALTVTAPKNAKGKVPVIMQFGGFGFGPPPAAFAGLAGRGGGRGPAGPTWQQMVIAKGWAYAQLVPNSIQADNGAGLTAGIIGLVNKGQHRKPEDWGALRAWAWGASRAIDYFETDPALDATHVAIEGHSRYGKAAVVAMAYEPRMWTAYVSSSGEGGAKLHRRDWGEIVENVAGNSEYHWMAGNFLKYAGPLTWNDLPVDSNELIALCAPRPVFLSAGKGGYDAEPNGDSWVDAKGTFLAGAGAGPVYKLLGKKDLGTNTFPPMETGLLEGDVAFRQHSSGHTDGPNWPYFLDWAAKHQQLSAMPKIAMK